MVEIKLIKLHIRNFKGIKSFEFFPNGEAAHVFGTNGSGKTSIYDAFTWCLFGKNSKNESNFEWKPKDVEGNEVNHLETSVETTLEVDGVEVILERIVEEKWTKKRGSSSATFDGHVSTFKIDHIDKKKKEYTEFIESLIEEETFKILTNLFYFPESMKWEDRRKFLLDISGNVTDEEVIAAHKELEPLSELLAGKTAEEVKEQLMQKNKDVKKQIKGLPDRIDEVDRSMPDLTGLDKDRLIKEKGQLDKVVNNLKEDILKLDNGEAITELESEVKQLRIDHQQLKIDYVNQERNANADNDEAITEAKKELDAQDMALDQVLLEIKQAKNEWMDSSDKLNATKKKVEDLRLEYRELQGQEMTENQPHETTCPTCGQELPAGEIASIQAEYQAKVSKFNRDKANRLKEIATAGKEAADLETVYQSSLKEAEVKLESLEQRKNQEEKTFNNLNQKLTKLRSNTVTLPPFEENEESNNLIEKIVEKESEIKNLIADTSEKKKDIQVEIEKQKVKIDSIQGDLNKFQLAEIQKGRLDELTSLEKELNQELGTIEQQIILLEDFTKAKVSMLTGKINAEFEFVEWKLFEEQINGGLREVCEPTVNGKGFSSALSNGERVKAGLDILNTLSRHYQAKVPVFVDNAEGVVNLQEIDTQTITLNVSKLKKHESLTVEKEAV